MNEFPSQFGGTHKRPRYGVQNNTTAPQQHHGSHTGRGGGHYGPGGGGGGGGRGMQGGRGGGRGQGRGHSGGNGTGSMLKESMLQDPWQHMMEQLVSQGLPVNMVSHPNSMQSGMETSSGMHQLSTATPVVYKNAEEISISDDEEEDDDGVVNGDHTDAPSSHED